MVQIKSLGFKVIAIAILGFSLNGCGGGGSSSDSDIDSKPAESKINTGIFIDAPVEGLKYETSTLSGYTDNQGQFKYKTGETVTFKIGNLELGSTIAQELVTPLTLTGENDLNNIGNKATNIARILQSLDENSSNDGLLKISASLKNLNISNIDLESEADLNTILEEAQNITSKTYILQDSRNAKLNMKNYISLYKLYPRLKIGINKDKGTKYYIFNMPTNGYVGTGFKVKNHGTYYSQAYVYDKNLNLLNHYQSNGYKENMHLYQLEKQGTYIIKVIYGTEENEFTVFSPTLKSIDTLPLLKNGTFKGVGTVFYKLEMPENGNIDASFKIHNHTTSYSYAYVYDKNLKPLYHYQSNGYKERMQLKHVKFKGTYIVEVINREYDELTVTSPVLN